ncbi:MAG: DUF2975 domain-containing protein [Verrucomicrobiota bacterium]
MNTGFVTPRIRTLAKVSAVFTTIVMCLIPILYGVSWLIPGWEKTFPQEHYRQSGPPSIWLLTGVFILRGILALVLVLVLYWLRRMLLRVSGGQLFGREQVVALRWAGILLVVRELLRPVINTLVVLLASSGNPPGHRVLEITVGLTSETLLSLVAGVVIILLSYLLAEARRISDENAAIV